MNSTYRASGSMLLISGLLATPIASSASDKEVVLASLKGFSEVPSISSPASGHFQAFIDRRAGTIAYELTYSGLTGDVQQAHIHFGQRSVNGSVSVFLCQTEAASDPTGLAPRCPQRGKVTGLLQAANMIEGTIVNQGIAPGEFNELAVVYVSAGVPPATRDPRSQRTRGK